MNEIQSLDLMRVESHPFDMDIDFSLISEIKFLAKEIRNCRVTGAIGPQHDFNRCNLVTSKLIAVNGFEANFDNVDFKDSLISDCTFQKSRFSIGAIAGCIVTGSRFIECSYRDLSVTETEFRNVTFEDCDLSKMLIKDCRFIGCFFQNCITSNKLFEASLVLDCGFENTELELRTIISNFGITTNQLESSPFRDFPTFKAGATFQEALENIFGSMGLSDVERFRFGYFCNPSEALISSELDKLLDSETWRSQFTIPRNFVSSFSGFVDFLLHLYDRGVLPVYVIWRIHAGTAELASSASSNSDMVSLLYKPLMGIQMTLARLIEEQVAIYEKLLEQCDNQITLIVEGPLEKKYYQNELEHLFHGSSTTITRLVPHNSPSELTLVANHLSDIAPFIAFFVCTRMNFEIQQLRAEIADKQNNYKTKKRISSLQASKDVVAETSLSTFAVSIGLTDRQRAYEIKLMTMLPGNYFLQFMIQLRLDVPTKTINKVKNILVGIISHDG